MKKEKVAAGFAAFVLLICLGCGYSGPAPQITAIAVDESAGTIYRSLELTVSEPVTVMVTYAEGVGTPLHITQEVSGSASIPLPRLHADATYNYSVVAVAANDRIATSSGVFTTGSLPPDLAAIPFTVSGSGTNPLVMLQLRGPFAGVAVVDQQGKVVWYYRTLGNPQGAGRRANGNWVVLDGGTRLVEIDWKGALVHEVAAQAGLEMHHDVVASPQNTVYYLTRETKNIGGVDYVGEVIWEWDPDHGTAPVRRWTAFDVFHPSTDIGVRSRPTDWFHANSLRVGPRGNLILSFHFFDQVNSIKSDFSGLEWRLGGPGSSFTLPSSGFFSGQHSVTEIATNDILMFDNGYARGWSRALEFTLDPTTHAATIKWQYRPSPDIWSWTISSARRLANGNTVVTFGDPTKSHTIQVHEVDASGHLLWKMVVGGAVASIFRGEPMESIAGEF